MTSLPDLVAKVDGDFSLDSWKQKTPRQRHCILSAWPDEEREFHELLIKVMRPALEREAKALDSSSLPKRQEEAGGDFLNLRPEWTQGEFKCWALCPSARLLNDDQAPLLIQKWGSKRTRKDYLQHAKTPRGLLLRYGPRPRWCELLSICYVAIEIKWATHIAAEMVTAAALRTREIKQHGKGARPARRARALKRHSAPHAEPRSADQKPVLEPIKCTEDDHEHLWIVGTFLHIAPKANAPRSKSDPPRRHRRRICWACGHPN